MREFVRLYDEVVLGPQLAEREVLHVVELLQYQGELRRVGFLRCDQLNQFQDRTDLSSVDFARVIVESREKTVIALAI